MSKQFFCFFSSVIFLFSSQAKCNKLAEFTSEVFSQNKVDRDVYEETQEFLDTLLTPIHGALEVDKSSGKELTLRIPAGSKNLLGIVTMNSHFPYDFYFLGEKTTCKEERFFSFKLEVKDPKSVAIHFFRRLQAHYAGKRYDLESTGRSYREEFLRSFAILKYLAKDGIDMAIENHTIQFDSISFFKKNGKVFVQAIVKNEVDRADTPEKLKKKLRFVEQAKSACAFGCMVTHLVAPDLIPPAEARVINKLFKQQTKEGKDKDGRSSWSLVEAL